MAGCPVVPLSWLSWTVLRDKTVETGVHTLNNTRIWLILLMPWIPASLRQRGNYSALSSENWKNLKINIKKICCVALIILLFSFFRSSQVAWRKRLRNSNSSGLNRPLLWFWNPSYSWGIKVVCLFQYCYHCYGRWNVQRWGPRLCCLSIMCEMRDVGFCTKLSATLPFF